jgi:hypothetical protein
MTLACSSTPERRSGGTGGVTATGGAPATGGASGSGSGGSVATGGAPGSADSGSTGGTPADAARDVASSSSDAGTDAGAPAAAPAAPLDRFLFDVPCPPGTFNPAGNCTWPTMRTKQVSKTFGGDPGTTYMVKLKICAVSEEREATGCQTTPATGATAVCVDGTPSKGTNIDTYPSVTMKVSDPPHTYQLNTGKKKDDLSLFNYSATFPIKGGASITFATDGGSNSDVYTAKWNGDNYQCPGVPGITQPFEGQFFYFTVESTTP